MAASDDPHVSRLREAGAIAVGKTNVPSSCCCSSKVTTRYTAGRLRNEAVVRRVVDQPT